MFSLASLSPQRRCVNATWATQFGVAHANKSRLNWRPALAGTADPRLASLRAEQVQVDLLQFCWRNAYAHQTMPHHVRCEESSRRLRGRGRQEQMGGRDLHRG